MRYVSHLACPTCGATYPADRVMNLCERDGRPVQMVLDLERLKAERGPRRRAGTPRGATSGGSAACCRSTSPTPTTAGTSSPWARAARPSLPYPHPLADRLGCRLEVKDEGKPHRGFGANPTLSFKDRGMALTVSMARALGLSRLAVPTQGNAGDCAGRVRRGRRASRPRS